MRSREHEPAPSPRRVPPAAGVHPVLALQRAAGNRAVTALLQRDNAPAPAPGGPVPASPLVDAAVDAWIDPKYIKVTIVAAPLELGGSP